MLVNWLAVSLLSLGMDDLIGINVLSILLELFEIVEEV